MLKDSTEPDVHSLGILSIDEDKNDWRFEMGGFQRRESEIEDRERTKGVWERERERERERDGRGGG